MARRYSSKGAAVAVAGTTFTHGLTKKDGSALTPDEWSFNHSGAPPAGNVCSLYMATAPGAASCILASSSGATTADIFMSSTHSSIE